MARRDRILIAVALVIMVALAALVIQTVADGGSHDPDFLVGTCGAHHRSIPAGRLHLTGKVGSTLRVHHADGSP